VAAIAAIKTADNYDGANAALIEEERPLHRSVWLRWDFFSAENSMGFHNPEEGQHMLVSATDFVLLR